MFETVLAPMAIGPDIVPPAKSRYEARDAVVARDDRAVPESCITLLAETVGTLPEAPVPALVTTLAATTVESTATLAEADQDRMFPAVCNVEHDKMLSAERVLEAPEIDPTLVMLFVAITIAPDIVPPAKGRYDPMSAVVATW